MRGLRMFAIVIVAMAVSACSAVVPGAATPDRLYIVPWTCPATATQVSAAVGAEMVVAPPGYGRSRPGMCQFIRPAMAETGHLRGSADVTVTFDDAYPRLTIAGFLDAQTRISPCSRFDVPEWGAGALEQLCFGDPDYGSWDSIAYPAGADVRTVSVGYGRGNSADREEIRGVLRRLRTDT